MWLYQKFILVDARTASLAEHSPEIISFTLTDLIQNGYQPISKTLVPGSNHFPVIEFAAHSVYDYVWAVEYDVIFSGNWSTFFTAHNSNADFLSAKVREHSAQPQWCWWRSLRGPQEIPRSRWLRSFNPVFRISKRAAVYLREKYMLGWRGHHEVTMPTLLRAGGFIIEDLGSDGSFVRDCNRGRWYNPINYSAKLRHKALRSEAHDMLSHPVKVRH